MSPTRSRRRTGAAGVLALLAALLVLLPLPTATATFPGDNGPLLTPGGVLNEDGSTRYSFDPFSFSPTHGVFSAQGDAIAYSKCDQTCDRQAIRIRTADGDDTQVVELPTGFDVEKISWSPDGTRLAVGVREPDFATSILLVVIEDGSSSNLVRGNGGWDPEAPDWQPTGELVAFTIGEDLFTIDATTKVETQRTFECTYDRSAPDTGADCDFADGVQTTVAYPSWHPDGSHIAVDVVEILDEPHDIRSYVSMMTLGSAATPVTIDVPDTPDNGYGFTEPLVSPDGTKVALTFGRNLNDPDTWIAPLGGGAPVSTNKDDWVSDWQPCPAGDCPSFSTERTTPVLKVTILKDAFGLNVFAKLTPAHPGSVIALRLDKKTASGWKRVAGTQLAQNPAGLVVNSFTRARAKRCRITGTWAGDADHLAVTTRKAFAC